MRALLEVADHVRDVLVARLHRRIAGVLIKIAFRLVERHRRRTAGTVVARAGPRRDDDLPARYAPNIDRESPFDQQSPGKPSLSKAEIRDIVAFLQTLTDGYQPPSH